MELQQIKYFLSVVDCGTFLAAAQHVYVTQPTLSAGIKKLEESLKTKLFHRGSRLASLTPAGEQFLPVARQSYNQLMAIKSELNDEPQKITIGVLVNIHMDHVAKIVSVFRNTYPHIMIEFIIAYDDELSKLLKEEKIDLSIVNTHTTSDNFTPLIPEQMCVVASKQHPMATKKSIELCSLHNELFIERIKCGFWKEVNERFKTQGIAPKTVMQAENDEFVLSLVAENLGISIMTDRITPYEVKFIPIKDFKIDQYIGISTLPKITKQHIQDFLDTILKQYNLMN